MTHAGTILVTRDLDLYPFNPNINEVLGLIVDHLYHLCQFW